MQQRVATFESLDRDPQAWLGRGVRKDRSRELGAVDELDALGIHIR